MKKIFAFILALAFILTLLIALIAPANAVPPQDASKLYYSKNGTAVCFKDCETSSVMELRALGIVNGDGNNYFRPHDTIKRAEFAQMCFNAFASEEEKVLYATSPQMEWWAPAEWWLHEKVIDGNHKSVDSDIFANLCALYYEDPENRVYTFRPTDNANYEWMTFVIYSIWLTGSEAKPTMSVVEDTFAWAKERNCDKTASFWDSDPMANPITREDAATFFLLACELS